MAGRGPGAHIVFDLGADMGASTCVGCGECVQACPTGALMPKAALDDKGVFANAPDRSVDSLCPYCGVGCQLTFNVKDEKIISVDGRAGRRTGGGSVLRDATALIMSIIRATDGAADPP